MLAMQVEWWYDNFNPSRMVTNDGGVAMRQYTNEIQTAKLIELGFEKPKSIYNYKLRSWKSTTRVEPIYAYSIGELMEILDSANETAHCRFGGVKANLVTTNLGYGKIVGELIDLLFDLCVKLKEEGVI